MRYLICLAGLSLALAGPLGSAPLHAQPGNAEPTPPRITGTWSFETVPYHQGICVMTGNMSLQKTQRDGVYNCALTAIETCTGQRRWVVEQSCKAVRQEGGLAIKSTIESVLEGEDDTGRYAPDNFALIIRSENLMVGQLKSAVNARAEFRREAGNVS